MVKLISPALLIIILVSAPMPLFPQEKKDAPVEQTVSSTNILLETVGILSGESIYVTYMSIGTLADSFAGKAYDKDFTVQMVNEVIGITGKAGEQLNKLLSSGIIQGDDIGHVKKLIETYELLVAEAMGLKNYALSGKNEDLKTYSEKRKLAWQNISELLGIK